ncbi:hypothetical protein MHO82_25525 [Vibrio sp. Of7-15]|uniref:hypothetical protein n=1 Tax=Vibrio sp. Of7-15 TaxID=2724879 RepID=UPI001EF177ED|nr:hypothetical protein [Vibrio sp. Of7-15]MCG7500212.1 hypothetical protein [Vibrio sp. Of7-15]
MSSELIDRIESIRASRLSSIRRNKYGNLELSNPPLTNSSGMYWIYTNYDIDLMKKSSCTSDKGAINIANLTSQHDGLPDVCTISHDSGTDGEFRLVYNGIAGKSLGVRGRIHQHFNGGKGTGCLSILKSSMCDLDRWRVSYVTFEHKTSPTDINVSYSDEAKNLERIWRLKFGWPLLCKI